jgi:hypothetical protein
MRRALLLIGVIAALGASALPRGLVAQTGAPVQIGEIVLTSVLDWQSGTRENVLISNNADGEVRLDDTTKRGVFTSAISQTGTLFNALGATWQADVPPGTQLRLELRAGPAADKLGEWQPLPAGDAQSQKDGSQALETLVAAPPDSAFVQLRATFGSQAPNAAPVLDQIRLYPINATSGPPLSEGLTRAPAISGPATRTPPPRIIPREAWGLAAANERIARQTPRGIVIHQIGGDTGENPLPFLRALAAYDTQTLEWDDLPFHYIIDPAGNIFEGAAGGPSAAVPRLAGGDEAVHVALLGTGEASTPARIALIELLAWLGEAYQIAPLGQHEVARPAEGAPKTRPNIAAHSEAAPGAPDPSPALAETVAALRQAADQATVRSRWYFAEGNTFDFQERLAVLNPGPSPASVRFRLLRQPGPTQERTVTVAAGQRFDLVINNVFSDTTSVPAIVEANAPVITERYMDYGQDISASPGATQAARVWYFAEGTTDGGARTFLALFNPQSEEVSATVTYMKGDGTTQEQGDIRIPPLQRVVVTVADVLPGVGFGARVIANQPIVAERTMLFGPGGTPTGFHTTPGIVNLSRRWYFAEGTTQAPFRMGVLVLNPNAQRANVAVTFLTPSGTYITRNYAVPPTTRLAINVNEVVPDLGVATTVESDRPVAAERALYWKDGAAGSVAVGATDLAYTWRFADGRTSGEFQTYLLFSNPGAAQARIAVEFVLADGRRQTQTFVMSGKSRYTLAVHQLLPGQTAVAATVRSTQPVAVERAIYPGAPDSPGNRGGATSFGVPGE